MTEEKIKIINKLKSTFRDLPTKKITLKELDELVLNENWVDSHHYVTSSSFINAGELGSFNGIRYLVTHD